MQFRGLLGLSLRLAAVLLPISGLLQAQSYYGGLRGIVSDEASAVVAGAKVTLTNQGTGSTRSTLSTAEGEYVFTQIVPGVYGVSVENPGFKKFDRSGVAVATQQQITLDIKLELGAVTQTVLVTEDVPLVESSNASQGQVLDNQKLVELPNLGRNPFMLSKIAQNVIQVGPPAYNRMEDQSGSSMISVAGGPVRGNNYLLDGIPITDANNRAIIIPSLEAVQEVKVQVNTYDAEMARTGGGMFNTLLKSGTNDYHGSAYGHIRRTSMDANNFFSNAAGIPISDQPNSTWGASLGGRVKIPKLFDGKNKTFFFLAVEHYDDQQSDSSTFSTPTALERVGNFSQSVGANVKDPFTGNALPGNIVPAASLSPVGLAIAATYAAPTSTPSSYGATDLTAASAIKARAVQYVSKFDQDIASWWRASLSYSRYYSLEPGDTWFNSPSTPSGWRLERRVDATALNNVFTLGPSTVLTVRYGFNRFPNYDYNSSQGFNISSLGFDHSFASTITPALAEFPNIQMNSLYSLGESGDNSFYVESSNNFSTGVSKYFGKHSLKAGFDYRKLKTAGFSLNYPTGGYGFNGPTYSGTDLSDLLMGYPYTRTADTSTKFSDFVNYYGFYVQDDFRLSSKITLNAGLRWEHETGVQEVNNALVVGFDTTVPNVLASQVTGISPVGAIKYAGLNGNSTSVGNPTSNKFGPRVGIAWQVTPKTVVRAGYGIYWAPQFALGAPFNTLGYTATTSYTGSLDSAGNLVPTLASPFPNGLIAPSGNSLGAAAGLGQSFSLVDPNASSPMVQQYSIDVQRELRGGIALELGYVGSHSTHMTLGTPSININALNPSYFADGVASLNTLVPNPYHGLIGSGTLAGENVKRYVLLLPYSTYQNINLLFSDRNHASYNSLIVKAQKRLSMGLTFLSTLTWSKNMDSSSGGPGNSLNGGAQNAPQNPYDMGAEYSLANIDATYRWATSFSYELPFGKGKPYLHSSKLLDYLVGGWALNGVAIYESGFPLQIYQSNLNSSFGYGMQRPNATGVSPATSGSLSDRLYNYINPAAFTPAAAGTFGNVSRTISMRGPGMANWDASLFKSFALSDKVKGQFRFEALNAFNTPLFASPSTNLSNLSTFGHISTQSNFARQLQLAMRFSF